MRTRARRLNRGLIALAILVGPARLPAEPAPRPADPELARSVGELRHAIGAWKVQTEFLGPEGKVMRSVAGSYTFAWVVPDRVVSGTSTLPELKQTSGLLFYVNEGARTIEMAAVGADGKLWVMTGPLGGDVRMTAPFSGEEGVSTRLRFTRFEVSQDGFESRMDVSTDGGQTWTPANHQVFRRVTSPG